MQNTNGRLKTPRIDEPVNNETPFPATFTTGYRKDLAVAREIIRKRRSTQPEASASTGTARRVISAVR